LATYCSMCITPVRWRGFLRITDGVCWEFNITFC
jgi:hypothetical protein